MSSFHINNDPTVAPAWQKLQQVKADLTTAERERDAAIANSNRPAVSDRDRAALALLADEPTNATPAANLAELTERVQTLRRAVEIQQQVYGNAVYQASQRIAAERRGDYAAIVKRGVKAVTAVRDYLAAERGFCDELSNAGVSYSEVIQAMPAALFDVESCESWLSRATEHYA